jgi:hypothetical protein
LATAHVLYKPPFEKCAAEARRRIVGARHQRPIEAPDHALARDRDTFGLLSRKAAMTLPACHFFVMIDFNLYSCSVMIIILTNSVWHPSRQPSTLKSALKMSRAALEPVATVLDAASAMLLA